MKNRWWPVTCAVAVLVIGAFPFLASPQSLSSQASDYVDARQCAVCHTKIYEMYQRTGMARSFFRPGENLVEDFRSNNRYDHAASNTHFSMIERGGEYFQRRWQIGFEGKEDNVDELEINYVMGSGNHARTYLHRTAAGALLRLPLAWYSEKGGIWAMNPGYDQPDQPNARKKVTYGCMFCHNAYASIPTGREQLQAEPLFEDNLPSGIDCQRCHGPGKQHIQTAQRAGATVEAIRGAIVNPKRLSAARQMEVCMQCHLETTSFQFPNSILKYERAPFSYRPGEPLGDFMLFFDHAPDPPKEDRFQIVNSAYRLQQSACFLKSNGAMQCTTCHDPHDAPRGAAAAEHYNGACRQCHLEPFRAEVAAGRHTASANCVDCHMPLRRSDDVIHAVMTDHLIQRRKPDGLLAERREPNGPETFYRGEVLPYYPRPFQQTPENELYLDLAQVQTKNNPEQGLPRFAAAVEKYKPSQAEFYVELGDAWRSQDNPSKAIPLYEEAIRRNPRLLAARLGLGKALDAAGQKEKAVTAFQEATRLAPDDAPAWAELGQLCVTLGLRTEAASALQRSIALDSELSETHYALGTLWAQPGGDPARAEGSYREAIRLQPDYAEAHMNLAIVLARVNRAAEAAYHFETAVRVRPDYALGHLNYGRMLASTGRAPEAAREFRLAAASSDATVRDAARKALADIGQ